MTSLILLIGKPSLPPVSSTTKSSDAPARSALTLLGPLSLIISSITTSSPSEALSRSAAALWSTTKPAKSELTSRPIKITHLPDPIPATCAVISKSTVPCWVPRCRNIFSCECDDRICRWMTLQIWARARGVTNGKSATSAPTTSPSMGALGSDMPMRTTTSKEQTIKTTTKQPLRWRAHDLA